MVIECAFGRLQGRFPILRRVLDINMDDMPFVIYACFVLHNFCELNKESIPQGTVSSAIAYDKQFQPQSQSCRKHNEMNETEGRAVTRVLTNYFDP